MYFRKYKESDAEDIIAWIGDEREFRMWSADRYERYPAKAEDINKNYRECSALGNFYPMTLTLDTGEIIGHLILRYPNNDRSLVRFGFIIVDRKFRGMGYGKKLIEYAIKYAKEELGAKVIELGVFSSNKNAYKCYLASQFKIVRIEKEVFLFGNEMWDCIEMRRECC